MTKVDKLEVTACSLAIASVALLGYGSVVRNLVAMSVSFVLALLAVKFRFMAATLIRGTKIQ